MNLKQRHFIPLFILGFLLVILPMFAVWGIVKNGALKNFSLISTQPTPTDSPTPVAESVVIASASCSHQKPTLSITPVTQTGTLEQTLTYNVFFQNMDADCPPTTFTFKPEADKDWVVQIAPSRVQFANGGSMNTTMTVTSPKTAIDNDYKINLGVTSHYPIHEQTTAVTYKLHFVNPL